MKTCITGGAGFIGKNLVHRLQRDGVSLRLLTRSVSKKITSEEYFVADLSDIAAPINGLFDDIDVFYHCAGEVNNNVAMYSLHVSGTLKLLREVKTHIDTTNKPIHWVQLSSVGVYGPPKGKANADRIVLETTGNNPAGEYEVTKAQSDDLLMQFAQNEPLFSYSILRPSIVIGKNMTNQSVRSLIQVIRKGLFFYIGSTSAISTYIHVDDVVDALVLCGNDARAKGQIFNLSNDCMLSEVVDAVSRHADVKPPALCVPEEPLRLVVKFFSLFGKIPLTQERIDALVKRTRYSNQKIKENLGFSPSHSIPNLIATLFDE